MLEPIDFLTRISSRLNAARTSSELEPLRRRARVVRIAEVERHATTHAVAEVNRDKLLAASMLWMGISTLYRQLKEYEGRSQTNAAREPNSL
jgi:DNA-binding NtrC family response regulator